MTISSMAAMAFDGPATRTRARRSLAAEQSPTAGRSSAGPSSGRTANIVDAPELVPSSPSSEALSTAMDLDRERSSSIPTDPQRVTIMDLPAEIIDAVCNELAAADLVSLCLVSSSFREFATRVLYRQPKISSRHTAWKLRTATRGRKGLVNLIKVLDLDIVDLCHASLWSSWHLQETGGVILDIMRYCCHVAHFRAQMPQEASMFWHDISHVVGGSFRYLQTFFKDIRHDRDPFDEFETFAALPPAWISMPDLLSSIASHSHLHTLAIRGLGSALTARNSGVKGIAASLRTLVIVQTSIKERDLLLLMGNASSVTRLTLIESTCISKRGLVDALSTAGGSLEELTIGPGWWGKSDTSFPIDDVAPKLRNLSRLRVEGDIISPAFFGSAHSHALGHHVRLDLLVVRRCHTFRPDLVLHALRNMSRALGIPTSGKNAKAKMAALLAESGSRSAPVKELQLVQCSKQGWTQHAIREAARLLRPGELAHDFDAREDEEESADEI